MQVEFKVQQSEIDKVMREVGKYGRRVSDEVNKETAYAAIEVERLATEDVPVDTGNLKLSIQHVKVGGSVAIAKAVRGMKTVITYLVGTNVKYAKYVEFGTENQRAQPFLRPAYYAVLPNYIRKIKQILRRGGK